MFEEEVTRPLEPEEVVQAIEDEQAEIEIEEAIAAIAVAQAEAQPTAPEATAAFLDAFFAELDRCGVRDVVVSPGSRSTGLAMKAFERFGDVYMDADERSAAFFALGLAKASGNPVAVVCTSGTAAANWMPAVLEAEASRVPLLLLTSDRPAHLQQISADQTCDQMHLFGTHVKAFYQMPLPSADAQVVRYARQVALDACVAAYGAMPGALSCDGGPVHINFPFDEPLKPATTVNLPRARKLPPTVVPGQMLMPSDAAGLAKLIKGNRVLAICGEGTATNPDEAQVVLDFARAFRIPLIADVLSGLRTFDDPLVIDSYDAIFRAADPVAQPQMIIRFGRWPVSKACRLAMEAAKPVHLVVDMRDTRDASASTTTLVRTTPAAFAQGMVEAAERMKAQAVAASANAAQADAIAAGASAQPAQPSQPATAISFAADAAFMQSWVNANYQANARISRVRVAGDDAFEGSYVDQLLAMLPEGSLLYCANSMPIRALDTFFLVTSKPFTVMANRGLAGIDGTISSAVGAAHAFEQTTLLIGDLALLHDANGLALQHELFAREDRGLGAAPSIIIVVLNNNGGAIFDTLPQKSTDPYFERLFLAPQNINVRHLAQAFGINYRKADTVPEFRRFYSMTVGVPGISIIEVRLPLQGVAERFAPYWGTNH